jgi:hypothetical protein
MRLGRIFGRMRDDVKPHGMTPAGTVPVDIIREVFGFPGPGLMEVRDAQEDHGCRGG